MISDAAHLGHARTWVHVDTIHRWLEYLGYGVRHVGNITDVNEKITARVGERTDTGTLVAVVGRRDGADAVRAVEAAL